MSSLPAELLIVNPSQNWPHSISQNPILEALKLMQLIFLQQLLCIPRKGWVSTDAMSLSIMNLNVTITVSKSI
jgi:hypothetical protein